MPGAVEVRSLSWSDGERRLPFEAASPLTLPLVLPAKTLDVAAKAHLIPYVAPQTKASKATKASKRR